MPDDAGALGGHGLEHQGVDQAEDGRVGADSEGQDQHRDSRESRVLQQKADGMPDVLKHTHMDAFGGGLVPSYGQGFQLWAHARHTDLSDSPL